VNALFIVCFAPLAAAGVAGSPGGGREEIAFAARAVFKDACAGCHGPNVARPKGRFGYVLDLKRIAANPELVVPGKPDESELWEVIRRNEMPPRNPLSDEQKEVVRSWIQAGAPPAPDTNEGSAGRDSASEASDIVRRVLGVAGRFHLIFLHFPIALLVAAAVGELWSASRGPTEPGPAVRFCVVGGAAAAVIAALFGWAYAAAGHGAGAPDDLALHRWLGTAAAGWAVATARVIERDVRRGKHNRSVQQLMVLVGAILVLAAGHFGGTMVHGDLFSGW
jgi:mono/diheme cytochrome c family protein